MSQICTKFQPGRLAPFKFNVVNIFDRNSESKSESNSGLKLAAGMEQQIYLPFSPVSLA
jgi:hypothetical protein